tara:strand:- start:69 stop:485 length:417 start_codon:yes stop_codon:yes gene_type:complete
MNYLDLLPDDIIQRIYFFLETSYASSIIKSWRRYYSFKCFIINSTNFSPTIPSFVDNDYVYVVRSPYTYFYFKQLNKLITGNESYLDSIYSLYYCLAVSIDDYEWVTGADNFCYSNNKLLCLQTAHKFEWDNIIELFG